MSDNTARIHCDRGEQLYRAAKYAEAGEAYRQALEGGRPTAEIYCGLGDTLSRMGKYWEAADCFKLAMELDPESTRALSGCGGALAEQFLYNPALKLYRQVIEADGRAGPSKEGAEAYNAIGEVFYNRRRFREAAENYQKAAELLERVAQGYRDASDGRKAAETSARVGDMHNNLGYAYMALARYDDAHAAFEAATHKAVKYPYAFHNLATLYWKRGKYREAMKEWSNAYYRYDEEALIEEARRDHWSGHFRYFGNLLHEVFGDLDKAERMYADARRLMPADPLFMIDLMNLYLEKVECGGGSRTDAHWKAKALRGEAEKELTRRLRDYGRELNLLISLGELHLYWKEYDESERYLKEARELDGAGGDGYTKTAKPHTSLGVLHMHRKEYAKAVVCFRQALDIERDDLTLRSNLAEAHLRAGELDAAEQEYARVLTVTPDHVESLIGMGEVSLAHADAGDADKYEEAATFLGNAVKLAALKEGSKRLKNKELAKTLYLRAYARGRLFDASKSRDFKSLDSALHDLRACFKADPELYLAKRALDKIEKSLPGNNPQALLERYGPFLLLIFSSAVFLIAQASLFYGALNKLDANHYLFMTFGSLLLVVASLYLPQVGKLKFALLELEKNKVDQIATLGTLGIGKWT